MILSPVSIFLAIVLCGLMLEPTDGASPNRPIIPGFERFHGPAGDARGGQLLLGELNCVACHKAEGNLATPKQAPILDQVAGRVKADFLRNFMADPHGTKPGTTMPHLFAGVPDQQRKKQVEAIVHYLASLGPKEPAQEFPAIGAAARGDALFHSVGCTACHDARHDETAPLATSVPLPDFMEKYTLPSLTQFLIDPLHVRPSGRMPSLNLTAPEARDIASYLLKGLPEVANVKYSYYEGSWQTLPDFDALEPKATGGTSRVDETLKQRGDRFGLRFEGFLRIDREGEYTFHLGSDDGSRLLIDGKVAVDVNGIHPFSSKSARVRLDTGFHPVIVDFFEQGGEEKLRAEFEGPGVSRKSIAESMSYMKEVPQQQSFAIQVDSALAGQGQRLFASVGCASCHELKVNGNRIASQLAAKPLGELDTARGCLSDSPQIGIPHFPLDANQKSSLIAAIQARRILVREGHPLDRIHRTMTSLNCYACHQRDGVGGVEPERDALFQTTMQEMGDEGRLPPSLDGVGAKLKPKWMDIIFAAGTHDRPYMLTRMPRFGAANAGRLTAHFQKLDTIEPVDRPNLNLPITEVKSAGWHMVGTKGFSCIKCHPFGPYQAEGIQAMDLSRMTKRLKEDWFKRYLRDPQAFRRDTRMPSSWFSDNSLLPDILDGKSHTQIHAVWAYLADGNRARTPIGLVTNSLELIPFNEAIIYRNFIEGAGTRAIGVGYPEGRHLAFDANEMRLALWWQGAFIDAKRHWTGRGQGFEGPAGDNVVPLPGGVPFARLDDDQSPWPNQSAKDLGYRFNGYQLTEDQRPTFLYSYGDVQIQDFPTATASETETWMERTITITSQNPAEMIWFRAVTAGKIEAAGSGEFRIDDTWSLRLDGATPTIRQQGNRYELLAPLPLQNRAAQILLKYFW